MSGGPSQTDTFDMKPGHANGGEFKEIDDRHPRPSFSEHLPKLAEHAEQLAIVRSLSTKEGDHARGTHLVRTGHPPMGDVAYPSIACSLAKQLATGSNPLPNYVSVAPPQEIDPAAFGPGFLGASYAPAIVAGNADGATPPATTDARMRPATHRVEAGRPRVARRASMPIRRRGGWNCGTGWKRSFSQVAGRIRFRRIAICTRRRPT